MSIKQEIEKEVMENISTQPEKRIANHLAVRAIWVSPLFLVISAIGLIGVALSLINEKSSQEEKKYLQEE